MNLRMSLSVINGDDITEFLALLSGKGFVAGRDYDLIGMPPVAREIFPATPRLRVAESNSFNLEAGTYFGSESILECLEKLREKTHG